jgi:hypothetical protein
MLGVAGIASTYAQNVYSVNVVGYTTVVATNAYVMIGNQLDDGAGNLATNHIKTADVGTQIFKFNPQTGTYASLTRIAAGGGRWNGDFAMTMAPGEGVFFRTASTVSSATLTFTGEVMEGDLINPVITGYEIYSPMVPQEGGLTAVHGYVPAIGDQTFQWNPTTGTYIPATYIAAGGGRWNPADPVIKVNEALWIKNLNAPKNWTRNFTVPRE